MKTLCGSALLTMVTAIGLEWTARLLKAWVLSRKSLRSRKEMPCRSPDCEAFFVRFAFNAARPEIFSTGRGFKRRELIMEKTAVFAPMPRARVRAATVVKTGLFHIVRTA